MISIPHNKPTLGKEEEDAALRVIRSGWIAGGKEVELFESEVCEYLGLPNQHAVAVSSGTSALYLALWVLKANEKQVAYPVYSCSALKNAIGMIGANGVGIDTSYDSVNLDIDSVEQSGSQIAIVAHMFGIPVEFSKLLGNIDVIEDCAQCIGGLVNGNKVGLTGKIGVFSFYATKMITSGGQGGMIVSKDRSLIDSLRDYREFDQRKDNKNRFNFQMTDLQAALGREQLKKLPFFIKRRDEIFARYEGAGFEMISAPNANLTPVRYRAIMKAKDSAKIIESLRLKNVKAIVPIEDWELLDTPTMYPNAYKLSKETISLPIYPSLTETQVNNVILGIAGN